MFPPFEFFPSIEIVSFLFIPVLQRRQTGRYSGVENVFFKWSDSQTGSVTIHGGFA